MTSIWRGRGSSAPSLGTTLKEQIFSPAKKSLWKTIDEESRKQESAIFSHKEDWTVKTAVLDPAEHELKYALVPDYRTVALEMGTHWET